jgi:predicted HTH transcriptional regulator
LPGTLTLESLRVDHPSLPGNPLIAESLYLARYIEKAGSGIQMMIEQCSAAGLPEPDFEQRQGSFVNTLWRDWLTKEVLAGYNLNARQKKAVNHAKVTGRINNAQYRDLTGISPRTALRELRQLTDIGIFAKVGGAGQSAHYIIAKAKPTIGK